MNSNTLKKLDSIAGYKVSYWEFSPSTREFTTDLSFAEIFHSEMIPTDIDWPKDFVEAAPLENYRSALNELLTKQSNMDVRLPLLNSKKWVRIVAYYSREDHTVSGFIKDVSSEAAKDQLYRNHNLELSAFEKGLEQFSIVARTDPKGRITYANEEFCRLSKYTLNELLGKDHRIVNSGYHPKEFFKVMWENIKIGRSWRGLVKNKAKDGSLYWVDTIVIPIRDTNGTLSEILSFRFDVTLMQHYREENAELKKEIEHLKFDHHDDHNQSSNS